MGTLEIARIKYAKNVIRNAKHAMGKIPISARPVPMDFIMNKN